MCGIAGFYSFQKAAFDKQDLASMIDTLRHRGPDSEGIYIEDNVGLAHRRLSVVDLSAKANQPFVSSSGRYIISYNGEIYNAIQIARSYNIPLKTTSDTEAIIELFERQGTSFVNRLNGMFVIVIYDKHQKELHVFRDRLGVKPLFYYSDADFFIFASEIKSLLELKYIRERIKVDSTMISTFLHLGYIPEPNSIFAQIKKVPSGCYMKITKNGSEMEQYWKLEDQIKKEVITDFKKAKNILKELLESSVSYRLLSDVPLGIFLSGGIDSSLIAAIAQKHSQKPINTFTIGFEDSYFSEAQYAKVVAKYLGAEYNELIISERDVINCWENLIDSFDEPFGDSSCYPTYLLSKFARTKVTTVLSGEGSDELFMGYGAYNWASRMSNPYLKKTQKIIASVLSMGNNRMKRAAKIIEYSDPEKMKSHIYSQEQYLFSEKELQELLHPGYKVSLHLAQNYKELSRQLSAREEQAFFDLKYYLKDDLLFKMDISSMRCSLEVRVPFLDYRMVEFAVNVSEDTKVKGNESKYLLKEVLYEYIPRKYFERPKKGFSIPLVKWLKKDLLFLLEDFLSEEKIRETGILNNTYVQSIKKRFLSGKEDHLFNRLYVMVIIQRWLLKNKYDLS